MNLAKQKIFIFNFILNMKERTEKDSIGNILVDSEKYWGAQTQRSLQNFDIGFEKMPWEIIESFAVLKMAAAETNYDLGVLDRKKMEVIVGVCGQIIDGQLMDHFPWGSLPDLNLDLPNNNQNYFIQPTMGKG